MPKMKKMAAITEFFQRQDRIAPTGGQKVTTRELLDLKKSDEAGAAFDELAALAAVELGVELA